MPPFLFPASDSLHCGASDFAILSACAFFTDRRVVQTIGIQRNVVVFAAGERLSLLCIWFFTFIGNKLMKDEEVTVYFLVDCARAFSL